MQLGLGSGRPGPGSGNGSASGARAWPSRSVRRGAWTRTIRSVQAVDLVHGRRSSVGGRQGISRLRTATKKAMASMHTTVCRYQRHHLRTSCSPVPPVPSLPETTLHHPVLPGGCHQRDQGGAGVGVVQEVGHLRRRTSGAPTPPPARGRTARGLVGCACPAVGPPPLWAPRARSAHGALPPRRAARGTARTLVGREVSEGHTRDALLGTATLILGGGAGPVSAEVKLADNQGASPVGSPRTIAHKFSREAARANTSSTEAHSASDSPSSDQNSKPSLSTNNRL